MARINLTDRAVSAAKAAAGERLEIWDALTPGLCLRVTDKGVKSWVLRYRTPDGRQPRLKIGDAKRMGLRAARLEAGRLKDLIDKGGDPQGEKRQARETARAKTIRTFGDLIEAYWQACEAGEWKPRKKRKRQSTIDFEKRLADRHATPTLGKLPLAEVKRATVKATLREMIAKGIGAQTNRVHAIIRQVFNFGIAEEIVSTNPAVGFEPLHDAVARQRIWKDAELKSFWRGCEAPDKLKDKEGEPIHIARATCIALQLCALLIQRRAEVAGMAVSELNFEAGTWIIPPERMKSGKPHQVPLPPRAVALIREALALAQLRTNEELTVVFPSPREVHTPVRPDSLTHALDKLRTGIGVAGATLHDLRRTGSTALTSERIGVSPFIRSKVLGHGTDTGGGAAVSSAHYDVNEYVSEKRRALEAWEALLLEVVGERQREDNITSIKKARR